MGESDTEQTIPEELPVIPLREMVVFPYMAIPLFMARERSVAALEDAMAGDRLLMLVAQRDPRIEEPEPDDLYGVGTIVTVMRTLRMPDGRVKALVQGLAKASIDAYLEEDRSTWVRFTPLPGDDEAEWCVEAEALIRTVRGRVEELLPLKNLPPEVLSVTANVEEPGRLADLVASHLRLRLSEAQEVLEIVDPLARLRRVDALLRRELDVTTVQAEIQSQAQDEMSRGQREAYLREQLRAIQAELGETDPRAEEAEEYRAKVTDAGMPDDALAEAMRQLHRLERMHPDGPEAQVVRSYLDWMVELPWSSASPDELDLRRAKAILDEDHSHLSRIKDRILEYLGVRKLRADSRGPILCFVGPPGVGKTSLGRSIARAMGREFVRISLGGVRDEAEIRGHRRTYVGALPGNIIQAIRRAESRSGVLMLDEIDKLGRGGFHGDPSSALLEVLDPEQNAKFRDNYLGVDFDLSRVLFIATANTLETIPGPLRDRMEVIHLPGYTEEEKLEIAQRYLIDRQLKANGLTREQVTISAAALAAIVGDYTREAGVRNLEREIGSVFRSVAMQVAEGSAHGPVAIEPAALHAILGARRFENELAQRTSVPGVATGLAWTPVGGDILFVEASQVPGVAIGLSWTPVGGDILFVEASKVKGGKNLTLTGQLGDVMKESATAALSFIRSNAKKLNVDEDFFDTHDLHIHVPAGAIPKDGPSAGVTMLTALISLLTNRTIHKDLAMTGEITLRGQVLPVGGIKEKVLAAHRAGIKKIILPEWNKKDLEDVPPKVQREIDFYFVDKMINVLDIALDGKKPAPRRRRRKKN